MKVDVRLPVSTSVRATQEAASSAEAKGYAGLWSREGAHNPFLPLMPAAGETSTMELGTSVALAFARSPMDTAYLANDLALASDGRFILGLGSQISAHIRRRYSMPWEAPARRMAEYVRLVREIWRCWSTGDRLDFAGDFYQVNLMTPAFTPPVPENGPPRIYVAAVGPKMLEAVANEADGLLVHPFSTAKYIRESLIPTVRQARERGPRAGDTLELSAPVLLATGSTDEAMEASVQGIRKQIAFYGSTPAYRAVLETHGWGDLAQELTRISKRDDERRWDDMAALVDDDVLSAFAVVARPDEIAPKVLARMEGLVDRTNFYTVGQVNQDDLDQAALELLRLTK